MNSYIMPEYPSYNKGYKEGRLKGFEQGRAFERETIMDIIDSADDHYAALSELGNYLIAKSLEGGN